MAEKSKATELVAGLAVVGGMATILAVVLWLGAADLFRTAKRQAWFFVEEAAGNTGLTAKGKVLVGSTEAGQIAATRFDAKTGRTYYLVDIRRDDVEIHADAKAVYTEGLLGGSVLIVTHRGSADRPLADQEHPVPITQGGPFGMMAGLAGQLDREMDPNRPASLLAKVHAFADGLDKIVAELNAAAKDVTKIAAQLATEMDRKQAQSLLAKIVGAIANIETVAATLRGQTDIKDEASILRTVQRTLARIDEMSKDLQPQLKRTMTNVEQTVAQLRKYIDTDLAAIMIDLRKASTKVLEVIADVGKLAADAKGMIALNRDNIDEMIDNLAIVSADLKAAGKEIRRNPWRLLYQPKKGELHSQNIFDAARSFSSGAAQLDQALSKLKALDPKAADTKEIQNVRDHLQKTFEKFTKAEEALWKELKARP